MLYRDQDRNTGIETRTAHESRYRDQDRNSEVVETRTALEHSTYRDQDRDTGIEQRLKLKLRTQSYIDQDRNSHVGQGLEKKRSMDTGKDRDTANIVYRLENNMKTDTETRTGILMFYRD